MIPHQDIVDLLLDIVDAEALRADPSIIATPRLHFNLDISENPQHFATLARIAAGEGIQRVIAAP